MPPRSPTPANTSGKSKLFDFWPSRFRWAAEASRSLLRGPQEAARRTQKYLKRPHQCFSRPEDAPKRSQLVSITRDWAPGGLAGPTTTNGCAGAPGPQLGGPESLRRAIRQPSRRPKTASNHPHDGFEGSLRRPKTASRHFKKRSRRIQRAPGDPPGRPREAKNLQTLQRKSVVFAFSLFRLRWCRGRKIAPKRPPGGPKTPPKSPQETPKKPQEPLKRPPGGLKRPPTAPQRPRKVPIEAPKRPAKSIQDAPRDPKGPTRPCRCHRPGGVFWSSLHRGLAPDVWPRRGAAFVTFVAQWFAPSCLFNNLLWLEALGLLDDSSGSHGGLSFVAPCCAPPRLVPSMRIPLPDGRTHHLTAPHVTGPSRFITARPAPDRLQDLWSPLQILQIGPWGGTWEANH